MFEKIVEDFKKNGFALIPDFLDEHEIKEVKESVHNIVEAMDVGKEKLVAENTVNPTADPDGVDKIKFYFENQAFDKSGQLKRDKHLALFRIGFNLHSLDPTFKKLTFSEKIANLVKEIGLNKPRMTQSMYIFKNPEIGGEFIPHQDATYLITSGKEPRLLGLWFPMEDANEENGCLSFIPGSHKTGLHRLYARIGSGNDFAFMNDSPKYDDKDFVSVPAKKGSCVLIDGLVVHKSAQNCSQRGRPVYAFHVYDNSTCEWDAKNWLQPTPINPFPALYER